MAISLSEELFAVICGDGIELLVSKQPSCEMHQVGCIGAAKTPLRTNRLRWAINLTSASLSSVTLMSLQSRSPTALTRGNIVEIMLLPSTCSVHIAASPPTIIDALSKLVMIDVGSYVYIFCQVLNGSHTAVYPIALSAVQIQIFAWRYITLYSKSVSFLTLSWSSQLWAITSEPGRIFAP